MTPGATGVDHVVTISPQLTDQQWLRFEKYGTAFQSEAGDVLFASGQERYPVILVDSGCVERGSADAVEPDTDQAPALPGASDSGAAA